MGSEQDLSFCSDGTSAINPKALAYHGLINGKI
jgi:hypothetical protein